MFGERKESVFRAPPVAAEEVFAFLGDEDSFGLYLGGELTDAHGLR